MRARITEQLLKTQKFEGQQKLVRDETIPGFCVLISKSTTSFAVQINARKDGRLVSKRRVFGRWPEMSVATARALIDEERAALRRELEAPRSASVLTVADAWAEYRQLLAAKGRSAKTIEGYEEMWSRVLEPQYGDRELTAICADEFAEKVRDHHASLDSRYRANRVYELLRAIHRQAHKVRPRTIPAESPTRMVLWNLESKPQGGRGTAMRLSDLPQWYKDVRSLDDPHRQRFHIVNLLTGSRQTALSEARWEHVDLEERVLHLPSPKGGSTAAYDLPLSDQLVQVLRESRNASPWLFPSVRAPEGHIVTWRDRELRGRCGKVLRRTYRTHAVRVVSVHIAEVLMGHAQRGMLLRYQDEPVLFDVYLRAQQQISDMFWEVMQVER